MYKGGNEYKQRRYERGLCVNCLSPRDSEKVLCAACREKQSKDRKARYEARKKSGLCRSCAAPVASNSKHHCLDCWFRKICVDRTGSAKLTKAIQELFHKQGSKCAYTGKPIQLGVNAQLDHKTPIPRGGKNVIENLHWVSASINLMKGQRTHKEFVALCRFIANRFS